MISLFKRILRNSAPTQSTGLFNDKNSVYRDLM